MQASSQVKGQRRWVCGGACVAECVGERKGECGGWFAFIRTWGERPFQIILSEAVLLLFLFFFVM